MKFEDIITELKNKIYKPVYFLHGEESYFIDQITDYIAKNVLSESEKAFNQTIMYGKDIQVEDIDSAARRFPMMSPYQVIIVKEAQNVKKIENLVYYAENPLKSTVLVINYKYKKLDKRLKLHKVLQKNAVLFESNKLYDNHIPAWINTFLREKNYSIDLIASNLLSEFLGNDLSKIANELNKLAITLPQGTKITPEVIEKNIGISKDYNNFELQNALKTKDVLKANRIINYFADNPRDNPIVLTITSLYFFFAKVLTYQFLADKSKSNVASQLKINPFFVKDYEDASRKFNKAKVLSIISILREYDLKSKGYENNATHGDLLKEMIFKILH